MALFRRKQDTAAVTAPNQPLLVINEQKTIAELWPNKITIRRHGMLNAMNVGQTGDKDIYLTSITGIQVKKPGMTTGYIQFQTVGSQDNKSGVSGAVKDENSLLFNKKQSYETALAMKERIESIVQQQASPPPAMAASVADELTKLAALRDQGILSDDEFTAQKQALLH